MLPPFLIGLGIVRPLLSSSELDIIKSITSFTRQITYVSDVELDLVYFNHTVLMSTWIQLIVLVLVVRFV